MSHTLGHSQTKRNPYRELRMSAMAPSGATDNPPGDWLGCLSRTNDRHRDRFGNTSARLLTGLSTVSAGPGSWGRWLFPRPAWPPCRAPVRGCQRPGAEGRGGRWVAPSHRAMPRTGSADGWSPTPSCERRVSPRLSLSWPCEAPGLSGWGGTLRGSRSCSDPGACSGAGPPRPAVLLGFLDALRSLSPKSGDPDPRGDQPLSSWTPHSPWGPRRPLFSRVSAGTTCHVPVPDSSQLRPWGAGQVEEAVGRGSQRCSLGVPFTWEGMAPPRDDPRAPTSGGTGG